MAQSACPTYSQLKFLTRQADARALNASHVYLPKTRRLADGQFAAPLPGYSGERLTIRLDEGDTAPVVARSVRGQRPSVQGQDERTPQVRLKPATASTAWPARARERIDGQLQINLDATELLAAKRCRGASD